MGCRVKLGERFQQMQVRVGALAAGEFYDGIGVRVQDWGPVTLKMLYLNLAEDLCQSSAARHARKIDREEFCAWHVLDFP